MRKSKGSPKRPKKGGFRIPRRRAFERALAESHRKYGEVYRRLAKGEGQ